MTTRRVIRLEISFASTAMILLAFALAILAAGVVISAQRVFTWVVASAVAAALIEILVGWLDRWMQRALAILLVLIMVAASAGVLTFGVLRALDHEVARLQAIAPAAAADIELHSKRFGKVAREIDLEGRVQQAVDRLRAPSSGLAGQAVSSVGAYTVCAILTVLFLSWAPKVFAAAIETLEPEQRKRARTTLELAFRRARRYVMLSLTQSVVIGLIGYATCHLAGLPASAPLGLSLGIFSLVPGIGIVVGSLPILLLAIGLTPSHTAVTCAILFVVLQLVSSLYVQRRIVRLSALYVGPAVISVAFLAGFELYGIGGAMYAGALAVLGVAAIDSSSEQPSSLPSGTESVLQD